MLVDGSLHEELMAIRNLSVSVTKYADACRTNLVVLMLEGELENAGIYLVLAPSHPKTFQKIASVVGILLVERLHPFLNRGQHLVRWMASQFATGAVTKAVFVLLQILQQLLDGSASHFGSLDERTRRIGNAIDTAVIVVAIRVAGAVLHMADERIVPIDQIQGTVGREFQVDGTEIRIGRLNYVLLQLARKACAILHHAVMLGAEKANRIVDKEVALGVFGKMARRNEFRA